jgi:hypothetical protein
MSHAWKVRIRVYTRSYGRLTALFVDLRRYAKEFVVLNWWIIFVIIALKELKMR